MSYTGIDLGDIAGNIKKYLHLVGEKKTMSKSTNKHIR